MKFIADNMLGKLAKWLRFSGYDTLYPKNLDDRELIDLSHKEDRFLLTRDKELTKIKGFQGLYIESENLDNQLVQVISHYSLTLNERKFTICPECNNSLSGIDKHQVQVQVPVGVFDRQSEFWKCNNCGQVYWHGSHFDKIQKKLNEIFK